MKKWLLLLLLTSAAMASDVMYTCEVDGVTQTSRPVVFDRPFLKGEITNFPQVLVAAANGIVNTATTTVTSISGTTFTTGSSWNGQSISIGNTLYTIASVTDSTHLVLTATAGTQTGVRYATSFTALSAGNWQENVRNRWGDSTVKISAIAFIAPTWTSGVCLGVTFQNSVAGSHTGQLTQAQMTGFNSGNWNVQMVVASSGSTTVTTDFKTMLGLSNPALNALGDCKNDYWLAGPVVTSVIVQDCTSASASDFGWSWNGTTMSSPATGNASTASLHPWAELRFFPSTLAVQARAVLENDWSGRAQDQKYALTIKTGAGLSTVYGPTTLTQNWGTRYPKLYWSGSAPGHIRIDHNFDYLIATTLFPSYDRTVSASTSTEDGNTAGENNNYATSYSCWNSGCVISGDHGDLGQFGGVWAVSNDFSSNGEGAPIQREELLYLYNMASCATTNGECAKAWDMLTGEVDANGSNTLVGYSGGAGLWSNFGNIPFHARESRVAGTGAQGAGSDFFYCPTLADKSAAGNLTGCVGGSGEARGKSLSRYAHSDLSYTPVSPPVVAVGTISNTGTWALGACDHWQDWAYTPYLLTGEYFYLEEQYNAASWCNNNINDGNDTYQSHGYFGFSNSLFWIIRNTAWAIQATNRAAQLAPDGQVEQTYYTSIRNSNLEVMEGAAALTGTTLTPNSTNPTCSSYNNNSANRWDWGRCSVFSQLTASGTPVTPALHSLEIGNCPADTEAPPTILDVSVVGSETKPWMEHYFGIVMGQMQDMGITEATALGTNQQQRVVEQTLDNNVNPFLSFGSYTYPAAAAAGMTCNPGQPLGATMISSYATIRSSWTSTYINRATFDASVPRVGNFPCADHGYSLVARADATFMAAYNTNSTDTNCPGGSCKATDAWTWINGHVPFFSNTVPGSTACSLQGGSPPITDQQIKFALTPRTGTPTPPPTGSGSTIKGSIFKGSIITELKKLTEPSKQSGTK